MTTTEAPALRLARYLKEFVGLRTTTVRDVTKYETVLWFADMPKETDCLSGAWDHDIELNAPWLEVKKQELLQSPVPPDAILPWIDTKAIKHATASIPPLHETILVPDEETELADGESPPLVATPIKDHPNVQRAYDTYRPAWEDWSKEQRRREAIQKVYADLFNLHTQVRKQGEIVEVVLGLGFLDWQPDVNPGQVPVRRHMVVAKVELEFVPAKGVMRVVRPGDGAPLRIEDDMLEAQFRPAREHYAALETQLEELGDEIWDEAQVYTALKTWARALSADAEWHATLEARSHKANEPVVSFAPALILRKRPQTGMMRIYESLIDQLSGESPKLPEGWHGLIEDLGDDRSDTRTETGELRTLTTKSASPTPQEIFFPLPANREQRSIVEAIDRRRGVLVQGPPGTGKSHTIANLICHLLATGKRVLITAETARALQVLKGKLPENIQPLCVSLLGQGGNAFAELNAAIQGITERQATYSKHVYDKRISETDLSLDEARRRLAKTDSEILSLRRDETIPFSIANGKYHGTASAIAERVDGERPQFEWLQLPSDAEPQPPLSSKVVLDWLTIRRKHTDEQIRKSELKSPSTNELPTPEIFAAAVQAERDAAEAMAQCKTLQSHAAYAPLRTLADEMRGKLANNFRFIEKKRRAVGSLDLKWIQNAVRDLIAGQRVQWDTVADLSRNRLAKIDSLIERLDNKSVTVPERHDLRKVRADAAAVLDHLENGGKWKWCLVLTPRELKGREYLRKDILVDGIGASDANKLQAVCDHLDIEFALADLKSTWEGVGAAQSDNDRRLCIALLQQQLSNLNEAIEYANQCSRLAQFLAAASPPIPGPNWLNGDAQGWLEVIDATSVEDRQQEATRNLRASIEALDNLRDLHDAHPVVEALTVAVEWRDINTYSESYAQTVALEAIRADQKKRTRYEELMNSTIPGFVECIAESLEDTDWDDRLEDWERAWSWAVANAWLEKRANFDFQQSLWKSRQEIENEIGDLIASAAALRSWVHFFERLSNRQSAALKSWREAVKAMGKGTGRSAKMARLRQEARQYMDECRDAIPVWIMPRYLVAEMVDPAPGRYDLIIVDEASQLGIESLFLFFIGKKMVVVGDDQQISPYGIGIPDDAIAGLQQHFLQDIRHKHALSPQSSLYGNAKIRFSSNIVLREHFRCMPEIIQFSNDLCYASNGTPLDPLRAYPANRLQPLVLRHVADGHRTGSSQHAQNVPEADAIVAQIAACVEDPRYDEATMGVISLQGEAQAKLIERKLLERIDPEVIDQRRLICGDAYAFQGDERNIMFLSMVAAVGETRIGVLSNDSARQRFNVAVSRAQDQLWLFHSATLDVLSDKCMRYALLKYMLEPTRRTTDESEQQFDSKFERQVYQLITGQGFHVSTQVAVGDPANHKYRIDQVVEGMQGRLAVECDGDEWHGPDRYEADMTRQRDLERAGWQFVRIRGGDFYRDRARAMEPVWAELERLGIKPGGIDASAAEPPPPHEFESPEDEPASEEPTAGEAPTDEVDQEPDEPTFDKAAPSPITGADVTGGASHAAEPKFALQGGSSKSKTLLPLQHGPTVNTNGACPPPYITYEGATGPDPREARPHEIADGLCRIISVEGPMLAKRAYDLYLRGCDIRRMGGELKKAMNKALQHAIRSGRVVKLDESGKSGLVYATVRMTDAPPVVVRQRGPREFEEIPSSELQLVARRLLEEDDFEPGSDEHLREVLEFFDLKRLTVQVGTRLLDVLTRNYPHVEDVLDDGGN